MTRQQTTVLWLGLILIFLNIIVHIGDVKGVIFGQKSANPPKTTNPPPAGNAGKGVLAPGPLSPSAQPTPAQVMVL